MRRHATTFLAIAAAVCCAGCVDPDAVYLVPIDRFPESRSMDLVAYYQRNLDLKVRLLPRMTLEGRAIDERRKQLIAEELIAIMRARHPLIARCRGVMIGLTSHDMYIRGKTWRFAFAYRGGDRLAVVSTARMDPVNFGGRADDDLLEMRLRKMLTKQIAVLHYGMPLSPDPDSVLYGGIMGLEDLDRVGEELSPVPPSRAR